MMTNLSASVSLPLHVRVQCARICTFREKSCSKGEDLGGIYKSIHGSVRSQQCLNV